jgi:hypothetical protein
MMQVPHLIAVFKIPAPPHFLDLVVEVLRANPGLR